MRDISSCLSENAINVSHSSCSSYPNNSCISSSSLIPSVQNAVTCVYKVILSNQKLFMIKVTWCKNHTSQGLTINFNNETSTSFKLNTNSRLFRKKKGTKMIESVASSKIEVFWDLSNAKYGRGPEPVDGFYVLIMVDSEMGLILGDLGETAMAKKFKTSNPAAKVSLISRQEHCSGNSLYTTKAQFCDSGIQHDILIRCSGENEGLNYPVMSVCIDKKTVIRVKRLQWNFRGKQTIFVDGLPVDLMWDLHDWFFNPVSGSYAVFMFRTKSGSDSSLWLEEKVVQRDQERTEFSFLIYARSTPQKKSFSFTEDCR